VACPSLLVHQTSDTDGLTKPSRSRILCSLLGVQPLHSGIILCPECSRCKLCPECSRSSFAAHRALRAATVPPPPHTPVLLTLKGMSVTALKVPPPTRGTLVKMIGSSGRGIGARHTGRRRPTGGGGIQQVGIKLVCKLSYRLALGAQCVQMPRCGTGLDHAVWKLDAKGQPDLSQTGWPTTGTGHSERSGL